MLHKSIKRRRFLQNAALFSAGLVAASVARPLNAKAKNEAVDAVIIGSGYGGAVAALRLGQAGIDTVILERGRRWTLKPDQNTFATYRQPDGRAAWLSTTDLYGRDVEIYTGVLEAKPEIGVTPLLGAAVGGGSIVNNAGMVVPRNPDIFYQVFPKSIDYDELVTTYFDRVRAMLNKPMPIPEDILATDAYDSTRLFMKHATKAGFNNYLLDLAVDWNVVREELAGTKVASTIAGEIWYGSNSGSKNSLDRNYLPQAEKTGHVEILPLHVATEITEEPGYGYRVSYNQINESGEVLESKSITCRYLFLAAGSVGTSKLLFKAKAKGTLPRLNEYVGKFWGTNGDDVGTRSNLILDGKPISGKGGFAGAILEHFDNPYGATILMDYPQWNAPAGTQVFLGMAVSQPKGFFEYDPVTDSALLHWNQAEDNRLRQDVENTYQTLDSRNATDEATPTTELTIRNVAHPLGGVVIDKACDQYGRVFGYKGLYVIDGALLPGSAACANPALTIAGLAERSMDNILATDLA